MCFRLCAPSGAVRSAPAPRLRRRRELFRLSRRDAAAAAAEEIRAPSFRARAFAHPGPCPRSMTRAFSSASAVAEAEAEAEAPRVVSDEDQSSKSRLDTLASSFSSPAELLDFEAREFRSVAPTPERFFSGNRYRTNTPYVSLSRCRSNGSKKNLIWPRRAPREATRALRFDGHQRFKRFRVSSSFYVRRLTVARRLVRVGRERRRKKTIVHSVRSVDGAFVRAFFFAERPRRRKPARASSSSGASGSQRANTGLVKMIFSRCFSSVVPPACFRPAAPRARARPASSRPGSDA